MDSNLAYQDEYPEELIDGKVIAMSPCSLFKHVHIARNITHIFYHNKAIGT